MAEHPIQGLMGVTIEKIRDMVNSETIIGDPIHVDDTTIIPVSRVTFGFGFAVWEKSFGSFAARCTAFVPPDMDARVFIIEFFGEHSGKLGWKCELLLSDSDNDRAMLARAGVAAVMANALPEIRALGDIVSTRDNDHDGVAELFERLGL